MKSAKKFFYDLIDAKLHHEAKGVVSICSSNKYVLQALFKRMSDSSKFLLIESTSNQVNQYGGYTGMKPGDFRAYVLKLAGEYGIDENRIILGGDHLGPNPFRMLESGKAMVEAGSLISECVKAGYVKIHLDASMPLKGDEINNPQGGIDPELAAERAAFLCKISEESIGNDHQKNNLKKPVYVIGTEVPVPGGSNEVEGKVEVTDPDNLRATIELTKRAFLKNGLEKAWERVVAVVCQPGVEFGDSTILDYDRNKALKLVKYLKGLPSLVGEAHSTDYQTRQHLRELVEDGFAILKVGPALTFALREALFALSFIEKEMIKDERERSSLISILEDVMVENPKWWKNHYTKDALISLRYSFFDRVRYYWNENRVKNAIQRLFENLRGIAIPISLLSQFLPVQYWKIREGKLKVDPLHIVLDKIDEVIQQYYYATQPR